MKEYLTQFIRLSLVFSLALGLQACGGSSSDDKSKNYAISANTSAISFSNEFLTVSEDSFEVEVTFEGNGLLVGYAPESQPVGWLTYSTKTVSAGSAILTVSVANAENIVADLYQTKIRLSTGDVEKVQLVHHDIDVSLLIWQMITNKDELSFKATLGDESVDSQLLTITSESENEWTAGVDADWVTIDNAEGTGNGEINVSIDMSNFNSARLHQANLTLTEVTTGAEKIIPIEVGIDRHRLFSNRSSLALTSLNNINTTSQTVDINSNTTSLINWQASSDVSWLNLVREPSLNKLSITINNNIALEEGLHLATVDINALDNDNNVDESVVAEKINIAFYKSSESSENKIISPVITNNNAIVNSPYLPYVYIGENNLLKTYHLYSGELVSTLEISPEGTLLEQLIIDPNGQFILAKAVETITNDDETTSEETHRYTIDLTENTFETLVDVDLEYEPIRFISVKGRHFVVTQTLEFADADLKRQFWDEENAYFTSIIDQASSAESIYALDLSDSTIKRYIATANDFTSSKIAVEETHSYRPELLGEEQAISNLVVTPSDSGIYTISPTSEWISFDGETFTDNGLFEQNENAVTLALTKSHGGLAHYARFDNTLGFYIDVYNAEQSLVNSTATQGLQPDSIALSSDDKRLVINASGAQQVEIINIEQIAASTDSLTFNATFGDSSIGNQTVTIEGANEDWNISSDSDWLILNTTISDGTATIESSIDLSKINGWGLFTGRITIIDPVSGATTVIAVELAIDSVRLFTSAASLAFNQLDTQSTLSHTVIVLTNAENNIAWQANSSVNWLSLSADNANNQLTVTALPAQVANGLHYAEVDISAVNANEALSGVIQVSLNKADDDSVELNVSDIEINTEGAVLDPIRPYFYVAQGDVIKVINIIDGSIETTINSPLSDVDLTNLVIHPDGSILLASNIEEYIDENEQPQVRVNHYQVNLSDHNITLIDEAKVTIDNRYRPHIIAMVGGKSVVVTQAQEFADLSLTSQFWQQDQAFVSTMINDVKGTDNVISFDSVSNTINQYHVDYNDFASQTIDVIKTNKHTNVAYGNIVNDIASNTSGTNLFTASLNSEWATLNGDEYQDQGVLHASPIIASLFVETDSQGNLFIYRFNALSGFTLSKYDSNLQGLWTVIHTTGSIDSFISPDYQRLISYDEANKVLNFDALPD